MVERNVKVRIYITLCSSGESPPPNHMHLFAGQLIFCRLLLPDRTADQSKEEIEQVFPGASTTNLFVVFYYLLERRDAQTLHHSAFQRILLHRR